MKRALALLTALLLTPLVALHAADTSIPIWPQGAPGALGKTAAHSPTLTPYLPANPSGAAMLLVPGGSYAGIYPGQTEPFALWLNEQGITAFVLRYRLGSTGYRYPSQLQDAVEAMRQIREQAAKWKIDPRRIGAMGFSAGGHLVTTLLNRPEDGDVPGDEILRKTSSELQVRPGLPPIFLWHTSEDKLVPAEHTLLYAAALREHGVPHELHLYQHGGHRTGLIGTQHPWFGDLLFWLRAHGFVAGKTEANSK